MNTHSGVIFRPLCFCFADVIAMKALVSAESALNSRERKNSRCIGRIPVHLQEAVHGCTSYRMVLWFFVLPDS